MSPPRPILLVGLLWLAACTRRVDPPPVVDEETAACGLPERAPAAARLLTRREYAHTVQDLFSLPEPEAQALVLDFPREPRVDGFDNNAISHIANPLLVEKLASAASTLAEGVRHRGWNILSECESEDRACAQTFVATFGRRAFRRPMSAEEQETYLQLYDALAPGLGHGEALVAVVEAVLLSPQFLYRVEAPLAAHGDVGADLTATMLPLGPFELASRLSYFLWGSMPDAELLDAAESGALSSTSELEAQARRLLAHPHAIRQVSDFTAAWLGLDQLSGAVREGAGGEAVLALQESVLAFTDSIYWSEAGSVRELLTSPVVFTDARIGGLYGGPTGAEMSPFVAPQRSGLLTQPGLMTLLSHPEQSSPIRRGVFVREKLLCDPVPAPPPSVDNSPPDPDPSLTTRERFRVHTEQLSCAGCHELIDPVGFTFEAYDHLGRHRTEEFGMPIDTSGALVDSPDPELDASLSDAIDLAQRLSSSAVVTHCLTEKWTTFALGRPVTQADACGLDFITEQTQAGGGALQQILLEIAKSQMFRYRKKTAQEELP